MADDSQQQPVNGYSRAVDPRRLYPIHFDALMSDLFIRGHEPERWRTLDANEIRLDSQGQEVEFVLVQHGTDLVWRRRVLVARGKLVRIMAV